MYSTVRPAALQDAVEEAGISRTVTGDGIAHGVSARAPSGAVPLHGEGQQGHLHKNHKD